MRLTGKSSIETKDRVWKPDEFVLSMLLNTHDWTKEPIILVDYKPLRCEVESRPDPEAVFD